MRKFEVMVLDTDNITRTESCKSDYVAVDNQGHLNGYITPEGSPSSGFGSGNTAWGYAPGRWISFKEADAST